MAVELTQAQAEELTGALKQAQGDLATTRKQMADSQEKLGAALESVKALEESGKKNSAESVKLRDEIAQLSSKVQQLAEQNTNLLQISRNQSNAIANAHHSVEGDVAWRPRFQGSSNPHQIQSSIFSCRQEAVEVGYYFMATMKKACRAREYAQKWLADRKKDLRFIPQVPVYLMREHAAKWDEMYAQISGGQPIRQDLATNATPGSILTTPQFANLFIRNVEEYGVFRQNALIWPMISDTTYIPRRETGMAVTWVNEAASITESDPSFRQLQLNCKKAAIMHQYSSELAEDESAAISLADILLFEITQAWAYEEDRIGFNGTGTGGSSPGFAGFTGVMGLSRQAYAAQESEDLNSVLKYDAGTGLDRTDEVTLKGLRTVIGLCHKWAQPNAKWYAHRTVLQDLFGIETTGGGPITSSDQSGRNSLLGYPTVPTEVLPASPGSASTGVFVFGDLRRAMILGDRRAPEIQTSEHYAFNTDQLTLRFTARVGFLAVMPTGLVVYVTAA